MSIARDVADFGIYHFGAHHEAYSPALGSFLSAGTIVPEPGDPQAL